MSEEIEIKYKQEGITPFWQKLSFFFLFPFRLGPGIFMVCIVIASVLAGAAFGGLGLALKGFLVYLGLRYAFNVLELFAKGRFEGESVDYTLWGPDKRPAKLGLVLVLYLVMAVTIGNLQVASRIAKDESVQAKLMERYKKEHAAELAQREREMEAFNKRAGLDSPRAGGSEPSADSDQASSTDAASQESDASAGARDEPAQAAATDMASQGSTSAAAMPDTGPSRTEIMSQYTPSAGEPLWLKLQPLWYWLLLVAVSLMLPAAAIVIALEDKFFKALNPAHVIYLTKSMGSAYFALWGLFLLIAGARQLALSVGANWPMALRFPVEMGLATYLGLVLFAMIGYTLYQFHQELNLDVAVDFDAHRMAGGAESIARAGSANAAMRQAEPQDPLERKVQALLAEGKVDEAIAEVKDYMRYDRYDPDANTRLHALYVMKGEQATTVAHGQQWLTALMRAGREEKSFDALKALRKIDPEFPLQDGDMVLPLGKIAFQRREFDLAVNLVRSFDKRYPKHKDTAAVFFWSARLASEHLRKHESAVRLLQIILKHFPNDAVAADAKSYLAVLEGMLARPAATKQS